MKNVNTANATLKNTLASVIGSLVVSGFAFSTAVQADTNPFGATELSSGYMVVAEGSCGEGKCGANATPKHTKAEGACGGDKNTAEGSCGADKKTAEASCGADKKHAEGSCGGDKKTSDKTSSKTMEGSCGEGKCGGNVKG